MRNLSFFLLLALQPNLLFAQAPSVLPEFLLKKETMETHLRYIASDEMEGRNTGSAGGQKAAEYIASLYSSYGLQPAVGGGSYFQEIPFDKITPPESASLTVGDATYQHGENMVVFRGGQSDVLAEAIFAGHGWVDENAGHDDYHDLDVMGKVVFVLPGVPGSENPFETFKAMTKKRALAVEHGAIGVVELYRMKFPWRFFKSYFNKERLVLADEKEQEGGPAFFYAFLKEDVPNPIKDLETGKVLPVALKNTGVQSQRVSASNVVGILQGSDKKLKNEYIVVSAHYDHIGTKKQKEGGRDSIYNGARDNGMGVVAMLAAIKSLVQGPPKRSVVFLACTGEEKGMIGSGYYVDHPLVPLEQTVFNLNNDGGGYNTTEMFSVIGFSRTNVVGELEKAALAAGLEISKDPAPEQNLYERSDNIVFAKKGIPAIDFAPGVTAMDDEIMKYYHQVSDNPESIDYDYLLKFCQAFAHATRLIADKEVKPAWTPGDKYER